MDQKKIGRFIAQMRKEQNITQKQLADQLEISDKTISKWECGNGMPENSLMIPLCDVLQINVNELLSGERLSVEEYSSKAEENIMNLISETEENKKQKTNSVAALILEVVLFGILITVMTWLSGGKTAVYVMFPNFIDSVTLLAMLLVVLLMLATSGLLKDFGKAFRIAYGKKKTYELFEIQRAAIAVRLTGRALWCGGILWAVLETIIFLHVLADPSTLGPNAAVFCLCFLYSAVFNILLLPLKSRLEVLGLGQNEM